MDIAAAIHRYCNYQERCHYEVRNKLYELGCTTPEIEQHIAALIEAGLLNEERYACAIASGRFRLKKWGRRKIVQYLQVHKISPWCIKKALQEIDADEYIHTLRSLAESKLRSLHSEKNQFILQAKLRRYLLQKGYEADLINDVLQEIISLRPGVRP